MWSVESFNHTSSVDGRPDLLGHKFTLEIVLRYRPGFGISLTDCPKLYWWEDITMLLDEERRYWTWQGDVYGFRPLARTFTAWVTRYVEAFNRAAMQATPREFLKGTVSLRDKYGIPFILDLYTLRTMPNTPEEKAVYIRRWMAENECTLTVEIDDYPSLSNGPKREGKRLERLLLFDCGVEHHRLMASQHLVIDQRPPQTPGKTPNLANFNLGWHPQSLDTTGFQRDLVTDHTETYNFKSFEEMDPQQGLYA